MPAHSVDRIIAMSITPLRSARLVMPNAFRPLAVLALFTALLASSSIAADVGLYPYEQPKDLSTSGIIRVHLVRQAYEVSYDDTHGIARWVCYKLHKIDAPGKPATERPKRSNAFSADLDTAARISRDAYTDQKISDEYDRGHMAPAYGIGSRFGEDAERGTYKMSNMVAQYYSLNRGMWKRLEEIEADDYANGFGHVWIIVGPIYDLKAAVDRTRPVLIPKAFFKIMLVFGTDKRPAVQGFIFPNQKPIQKDFSRYLASIDEIEALTGLDFFPAMPKDLQTRLEKQKPKTLWKIHGVN